MAEDQPHSLAGSIQQARQWLTAELHAQAEHLGRLQTHLVELQQAHERTRQQAEHQWDDFDRTAAHAAAEYEAYPERALAKLAGAIHNLAACTLPEQVFSILAQEAAQWGARAAIFDVRGRAAWGAFAQGFDLTPQALHGLVIPLSQDGPFREACTGESTDGLETNADALRKHRNLLDKLQPVPNAPILLLPIRSAGTVTAVCWADGGPRGERLGSNALKILAAFAGAQLDRLIAVGGGLTPDEPAEPVAESPVFEATDSAAGALAPTELVASPPVAREEAPEPVVAAPVEPAIELAPGPAEPPAPAADWPLEFSTAAAESAPAGGNGSAPVADTVSPVPTLFDPSQLSEAEQKVHRDARRFAKLLVSEIELYNKAKVAEGRRSRDLYVRLKSDIDRSRQTYEKRFGRSLSNQFDYFHDELVKTLAVNDPVNLGPEYPGPPQ